MKNVQTIKSIRQLESGEIEAVVVFDKKQLVDEFIPYYEIKDDLRKALLPILTEEILKDKEKIVAQVLKEVNWPDIVRSEIARKVIKEAAQSY